MSYSLETLWYERARYLPGVLAVAFSALLIALQCGLLMGLFAITSIPIDHTHADIWMGAPRVLSVDLGEPINEGLFARLQNQPEVERTEFFLQGFGYWSKPGGGRELCMIIGSNLGDNCAGPRGRTGPGPALQTVGAGFRRRGRLGPGAPGHQGRRRHGRDRRPRGRGRCAWSV